MRAGKYELRSKLGAGGMGEVWKAWDPELGREVAVKLLKGTDADEIARFKREAQTAAKLSHPNIAAIYDVGEDGGRHYIAMQYVEGQTLATYPRDDRRALVSLMRDAALAVHAAHERGIVHRDLKPRNLMVERGRVFVMDFGLAKAASVGQSLSASGMMVGTPAYMSPEAAQGRVHQVGARSNVYGLGATLYELMCDRPPFRDETILALVVKVVEQEPPALRTVKPDIDRDLETIVSKCLEKDPRRRYASARELADDLGRWLGGEAIAAHPPSTAYRLRKRVAKKKALLAVAVLGAAAVALSVGVLVPMLRAEAKAKAEAEARQAAMQEVNRLWAQLAMLREWMRQPFREPAEIRRQLGASLGEIDAFVKAHAKYPQGWFLRGRAKMLLGNLAGAEADLTEATRLEPGFGPAWTQRAQVALERYQLALYTAMDRGTQEYVKEARAMLETARRTERSTAKWGLSRTPDDEAAEVLTDALGRYHLDGDKPGARRALEEAERRSPSEHYCRWLAHWCDGKGELAEKARWSAKAVEIAPHDGWARALNAFMVLGTGGPRAAEEEYTKAIEIMPEFAGAYTARSAVRMTAGRLDGAIEDATRAIELEPSSAMAYVNRAAARSDKGDYAGAVGDCTKAIELHPDNQVAYLNRGLANARSHQFPAALADYARAIEIAPRLPFPYHYRGLVHKYRGDRQAAAADFRKALEVAHADWPFRREAEQLLREMTGD